MAFYYETPCKATVKTAVKVKKSFDPYCCDEGATMSHEIFDHGLQYFIRNVRKTVSCGFKCCKKVFVVERKTYWDSMREMYITKNFFDYTDPDIISVTSCADPGLTDCITGNPIPCDGNCDDTVE